jgi:hypothetical protein
MACLAVVVFHGNNMKKAFTGEENNMSIKEMRLTF